MPIKIPRSVRELIHGPDSDADVRHRDGPYRHEFRNSAFALMAFVAVALSISYGSAWLAVLFGIAAIGFVVASALGALARASFDRGRDVSESRGSNQTAPNVALDARSAGLFVTAVSDPDQVYIRIKESVRQLSRAYAVHTEYTVRLPEESGRSGGKRARPDNRSGSSTGVYIPLVLARKGVLHDDLRISVAGQEVPTLSFELSVRVAEEVLLTLAASNAKRERDFQNYLEVHRDLVDVIGSRRNQPSSDLPNPAADAAYRLGRAEEAIEKMNAVVANPAARQGIAQVVRLLSTNYFIISTLPSDMDTADGWVVISTDERVILGSTKVASEGFSPGALMSSLRGNMQRLYGVRPSRLEYPVTKALRTASYHLEVMGSEGTYLSRQRLDAEGYAFDYQRFRSRRGQRYMHLYLRGFTLTPLLDRSQAKADGDPRVVCHYSERMPGSYGAAAVSAVAAAVVLFIASRHGAGSGVDIMALLIAAPGAFLGISGFSSAQSPTVGASVLTRVSASITVVLSVVALMQFILTHNNASLWLADSTDAYVLMWRAIVAGAGLNAIFVVFVWIKSAMVHFSFVDEGMSDMIAPQAAARRSEGRAVAS